MQDSIKQNRLASLRRSVGHNEYEGSIEESSVGNKKTTKQWHKNTNMAKIFPSLKENES